MHLHLFITVLLKPGLVAHRTHILLSMASLPRYPFAHTHIAKAHIPDTHSAVASNTAHFIQASAFVSLVALVLLPSNDYLSVSSLGASTDKHSHINMRPPKEYKKEEIMDLVTMPTTQKAIAALLSPEAFGFRTI